MTKKRFIVIHHSLTRDGATVNWQAIRHFHLTDPAYRFTDIGYHFGIELVNDQYEVLMGRMPDSEGAHCRELGMNTLAYGICWIGNFDLAPPPMDQFILGRKLVGWLMQKDDIPVQNVLGHREVGAMAGFDWRKNQYKSCPGSQFDMDAFRASLV